MEKTSFQKLMKKTKVELISIANEIGMSGAEKYPTKRHLASRIRLKLNRLN